MEEFSKWFCLKDRVNFTIDPQINQCDACYYFGRDDIRHRLHSQLRRGFIAPGVPKMMVWGPYGSGKTQTLFYLKYYLETHTPSSAKGTPHALYVPVELRANANAPYLHMQIMEALGKETVTRWVRKLFEISPDLQNELAALTVDPNIVLALKELRASGESSFTAWRWLTAQPLKSSELSSLQLTRNLGEVGAGDLVNAVVAVGSLARRVGETLIFLLDELEELQNVKSGDTTESIHQYVRRLADPTNSSVGFLIGFKADVIDDAPEILRRGDVVGRIGSSNYVDIPPLPAVSDVKAFMRELLENLTDPAAVQERISTYGLSTSVGMFPFTVSAFELLADYATQDIARALPRYIINAINECSIEAWDEEKRLVDDEVVTKVASLVFS